VAVMVWYGLVRYGAVRHGGSGMLGSVKVGHGMAKYGGRGAVRSGLFWFRVVRSVKAVMVGHVSVRYVWVRCGLSRRFRHGPFRLGTVRRSWRGKLCRGGVGSGLAVEVRHGEIR